MSTTRTYLTNIWLILMLTLAGCMDASLTPMLSENQIFRKITVASGTAVTLEEGIGHQISLAIETPSIPGVSLKAEKLQWTLNDTDGDFESSTGTLIIQPGATSISFIIKALRDGEIESDESFELVFSGNRFSNLEGNSISFVVKDKTTKAKVNATLASLNFGPQLKDTSVERALSFSNSGDAAAENLNLSALSAPFAFKGGSFPGSGGTCSATLAGHSSCTVVITYNPTEVNTHTQNLSRLVYDHGGYDERPPLFRVTVTFKDVKGKTQMDMTMTFPSPEAAKEIGKFIKQASGYSTWDRLAEYLAKEQNQKDLFVINRSFEAPIATLFDMWTKPQHLSQWLPPTGFTMSFIRSDIREGGKTFYKMTDGKAVTMYGRTEYMEIQTPHRIVYTQQFCDENENLSKHPLVPTWPATMLTTVTLTEEAPDQTRVTVIWEVQGIATAEEMAVFNSFKGSMTQGWTGSFDKLEEFLAKSS